MADGFDDAVLGQAPPCTFYVSPGPGNAQTLILRIMESVPESPKSGECASASGFFFVFILVFYLVFCAPGNAQTLIPGISYGPYRNPEAGGVRGDRPSAYGFFFGILHRCFYLVE